jgi:peptidoglycan hydrolase CwlO-like protein
MIANEDQARDAYALLRGSRDALSQDELNGTAGHRTWASFAVDARGEIAAREAAKQATAEQLSGMQNVINQLNQTVTELQATDASDVAKVQELQGKVAELTTQLETAHDQIAELQKQPPVVVPTQPVNEQVVVTNWLLRLWNSLFKKG